MLESNLMLYPVLNTGTTCIARTSPGESKATILGSTYYLIEDGKAYLLDLVAYRQTPSTEMVEEVSIEGEVVIRENDDELGVTHLLGLTKLSIYKKDFQLMEGEIENE